MSYYLYDVDGYVADGPSIGGLSDLLAWQDAGSTLRSFLFSGKTHELEELAVELEEGSSSSSSIEASRVLLLEAAKRAKQLLILSDGVQAEELRSAARSETHVHAAADAHFTQMHTAVMYGFLKGRKAYKSKGSSGAVAAIRTALKESLPPVLLKTLIAGGNATLSSLPKKRAAAQEVKVLASPSYSVKFDAADPRAAKWAREHAAELAKGISATSEAAIKAAIALQAETGEDSYDAILDAVGDPDRAEMIARTESMRAANEGNREAWSQAVEDGLLPEDAKKEWIAAGSPCPECEELDGEEVGLDEEYPNDGGDGPPLHPNCRCTEGIVL